MTDKNIELDDLNLKYNGGILKYGGRWRDRTADILLVRQTLYQLS